mmetsp:Transcript_13273/g.19138  ORF Transcript_13273/g.19138 Transcript_13273/m.19138 type:complete len:98 (+) Transcript_13273:141-434(+)
MRRPCIGKTDRIGEVLFCEGIVWKAAMEAYSRRSSAVLIPRDPVSALKMEEKVANTLLLDAEGYPTENTRMTRRSTPELSLLHSSQSLYSLNRMPFL